MVSLTRWIYKFIQISESINGDENLIDELTMGTLTKSNTSLWAASERILLGEDGAELMRCFDGRGDDSFLWLVDAEVMHAWSKGEVDWNIWSCCVWFWLIGEKTWVSKPNNWPIKLKFGEIMRRRDFTNSYASSIRSFLVAIKYAIQIVADLLIPAWQWTKTFPFDSLTESE